MRLGFRLVGVGVRLRIRGIWATASGANEQQGFPPVRCPHTFRSLPCGYHGPAQDCDKTIHDCRARGNAQHFGGFPIIPDLGD